MSSKEDPYRDLYDKQRPTHDDDAFSRRHPKMPVAKRAKIFLPFDALRGFDAAIDIAGETPSATDADKSPSAFE